MKIKNLILLFLFILCLGSCRQNLPFFPSSGQSSYLVFGHFHGECVGEKCMEIFKIEDGKVFEDTLDIYPFPQALPNPLSFVQLPDDKYQKVKNLIQKFPNDLYDEKDVVIGQPDYTDLGGFYVETNISGEQRYWLIDKIENNIPDYLHEFTAAMAAAISELSSE